MNLRNLEHFFETHIDSTKIRYGNNIYTSKDFGSLTDTVIPDIQADFVEDLKQERVSHFMNDTALVNLILIIDSLSEHLTLRQHEQEIRELIKKLTNSVSKTQAVLHFCDVLVKTQTLQTINFFDYYEKEKSSYSITSKSVQERITCLTEEARIFARHDYPLAVNKYYNVLYICDSLYDAGQLQEYSLLTKARSHQSVAKLYQARELHQYLGKATEHYLNAALAYEHAGDTINEVKCLLQYAASLLTVLAATNRQQCNEILDGSKPPPTPLDIHADKYMSDLSSVLEICDRAQMVASSLNYHCDITAQLHYVLGYYWGLRGKYSLAANYFRSSLVLSTCSSVDSKIGVIYRSLYALSWISSKSNDAVNTNKFSDAAIDLALREDNEIEHAFSMLIKAAYLRNIGDIKNGIIAAKRSLRISDSIQNGRYYYLIKEKAYAVLGNLYAHSGNNDSAMYYTNLYSAIQPYNMEELFRMTQEEQYLVSASGARAVKKREQSISSLTKDNRRLLIALVIALAISILCAAGITLYRRKLILELARLRNTTKGKLHNLRNTFNDFTSLVHSNDMVAAIQYAEKSAFQLSLSVNNWEWDSNNWTLDREIQLLEAYYETEKCLGIQVEISFEIDDLDIRRTRFIPEVFTTLLHNSIHHGFKNRAERNEFKIKIYRRRKLLYVEVSDNGIPSKPEHYLGKSGSIHGLQILKHSIETVLKLSYLYWQSRPSFVIDTAANGTTVKFKYPYANAI